MRPLSMLVSLFGALLIGVASNVSAADSPETRKIVLVAGEIAKVDTLGHHDYLAGCECLRVLLEQTAGVECVRVDHGWPKEESVFDDADSIVFYTDGGGKQAFLETPERLAKVDALAARGAGLVMIHQAVDFPEEFADYGRRWLGGIYLKGHSGRGHWPSVHAEFPEHPITRGVTAWKIKDGWLNGLQFVDDKQGVTPLVWSGKDHEESRAGLDGDIVGWAYERPDGGRSFSFTGLDAHEAWELPGMRQLVVNGVFWSANGEIPEQGAACQIEVDAVQAMQTPREPKPGKTPAQ